VGLFIVLQLVPYGRSHANPPVTGEPHWDSQATRSTFARACGDCHSNQTRWPWYSQVAPVSWMVQNHVEEGREHLNVSTWSADADDRGGIAREVIRGEMPLWSYRMVHREARLDAAAQAAFVAGLQATFAPTAAAGPANDKDGD
jgi:mono/diheme cytochrome c family protein